MRQLRAELLSLTPNWRRHRAAEIHREARALYSLQESINPSGPYAEVQQQLTRRREIAEMLRGRLLLECASQPQT
jgi:hypothetical protein